MGTEMGALEECGKRHGLRVRVRGQLKEEVLTVLGLSLILPLCNLRAEHFSVVSVELVQRQFQDVRGLLVESFGEEENKSRNRLVFALWKLRKSPQDHESVSFLPLTCLFIYF